MGGDVRLRLPRRIVAQAMGQRVDPAERALGAADLAERDGVGAEQLEQRHRVRATPIRQASHALYQPTEPDIAEPDQRHPALELDTRRRARRAEAEPPARAVGKRRVDPAAFEPPVDLVEDAANAGRNEPRDQAAAGREAAVACTRCAPRVLMTAQL